MDSLEWRWFRYGLVFITCSLASWFAVAKLRETFDVALSERDEARLIVGEQARKLAQLDGHQAEDVDRRAAEAGYQAAATAFRGEVDP